MDWNRDIFTLYPASYIKQEMDCPYVLGKIYKIPYPPDDISGSNFYQYDREHGKRYSVVRICICSYKNQRRCKYGEKYSYALCLLGIYPDVSASGTTLEHVSQDA